MTKRWSSIRSDLTKTKRQASKDARQYTIDPQREVEDVSGITDWSWEDVAYQEIGDPFSKWWQ